MEAVHKTLEQFKQTHRLERLNEVEMDEVLDHPAVKQWWANHPDLSREDLLRFSIKLYQYVQEQEHCQGCQGLPECSNLMKGYAAELIRYGNMLDVSYAPCAYQKQMEQAMKRNRLIQSHRIPKDILSGSFRHFDQTENGRIDAFNAVLEFCLQVQPGKSARGIYLYGGLGVGKSYLLGAACNKLAERNIGSYMVYTPEFFREMKGAIAEQRVEEKIRALQEVPVLIFDDIGAESISGWARDEVLGPILQYRIMENLPTLYTSNYDYDQLEKHLAYSQKGGIEQLKAKRIMERIRHYTDAYFLNGRNRRKQ